MQVDPFPDQPYRCSRSNVAVENVPSKIEHCFLTLMLCMKMRRRMFVEKHLYYNTEEGRNRGHSTRDDYTTCEQLPGGLIDHLMFDASFGFDAGGRHDRGCFLPREVPGATIALLGLSASTEL